MFTYDPKPISGVLQMSYGTPCIGKLNGKSYNNIRVKCFNPTYI